MRIRRTRHEQITAAVFLFVNLGMFCLGWFSPQTIPARGVSLLIGCMILAVGICVEVAPNVIVVPGEGIVRAISYAGKKDFGKVKVCFDVTLIARIRRLEQHRDGHDLAVSVH